MSSKALQSLVLNARFRLLVAYSANLGQLRPLRGLRALKISARPNEWSVANFFSTDFWTAYPRLEKVSFPRGVPSHVGPPAQAPPSWSNLTSLSCHCASHSPPDLPSGCYPVSVLFPITVLQIQFAVPMLHLKAFYTALDPRPHLTFLPNLEVLGLALPRRAKSEFALEFVRDILYERPQLVLVNPDGLSLWVDSAKAPKFLLQLANEFPANSSFDINFCAPFGRGPAIKSVLIMEKSYPTTKLFKLLLENQADVDSPFYLSRKFLRSFSIPFRGDVGSPLILALLADKIAEGELLFPGYFERAAAMSVDEWISSEPMHPLVLSFASFVSDSEYFGPVVDREWDWFGVIEHSGRPLFAECLYHGTTAAYEFFFGWMGNDFAARVANELRALVRGACLYFITYWANRTCPHFISRRFLVFQESIRTYWTNPVASRSNTSWTPPLRMIRHLSSISILIRISICSPLST